MPACRRARRNESQARRARSSVQSSEFAHPGRKHETRLALPAPHSVSMIWAPRRLPARPWSGKNVSRAMRSRVVSGKLVTRCPPWPAANPEETLSGGGVVRHPRPPPEIKSDRHWFLRLWHRTPRHDRPSYSKAGVLRPIQRTKESLGQKRHPIAVFAGVVYTVSTGSV